MKIAKFTFNMFGENCYVVYSPESRECMIVDPGMLYQAEIEALDKFIADENLSVKYLVNTHLHLDHCFGNNHISAKYKIPALAHIADHPLAQNLKQQAMQFGINDPSITDVASLKSLEPSETLSLGNEKITVIHVPGHSPGGIALYASDDKWVITGDSLFAGSIGRTDLPGGNYSQLIRSITDNLLTLPPETVIFPGHGNSSTIANELHSNPYL